MIYNGIFREKFLLFFNPASWSEACDIDMLLNILIDSIKS